MITVSNIIPLLAFSTPSLISLCYTVDSRDPLFEDAIRLSLLDKDEAGSTSTGGCVRSVFVSELADKSKDELQGEPS